MLELGSTDDWSVLGPIEYQAPAATIATPSEPIYGYDEPRDHSNDCKWNMEARQTVVAGALIGPGGVYIATRVSIFGILFPRDKILGSPRVENRAAHRDLTGSVPQYIQVSLLFTTGTG